jgi:hypothetical protein
MLRLLERNIGTIEKRLVLVAPPKASISKSFRNITVDARRHCELVEEMQRLRGSVYLSDGAVLPSQLTSEGLHQTPEDARSWHLLMLNASQRVSSCAWYMEHDDTARFEHLRVRQCALARSDGWRERLVKAVEAELLRARKEGLRYAEVGGWAVAKQSRCTSEGLLLALAAYSLGRRLGGALGLTTATVRHSSSTILRRIGGSVLVSGESVIPPYYDPKYDCEMELLSFDSRRPNPKYDALIQLLGGRLENVRVFATDATATVSSQAAA